MRAASLTHAQNHKFFLFVFVFCFLFFLCAVALTGLGDEQSVNGTDGDYSCAPMTYCVLDSDKILRCLLADSTMPSTASSATVSFLVVAFGANVVLLLL